MRSKFLFFLFIIINSIAFSQVPAVEWQRTYGGSDFESSNWKGSCTIQTSDLGYIMVGSSKSNNGDVTGNHLDTNGNTTDDIWVVKTNSFGDILWQKSLGGTGSESAYCVKQTTDGGYIIAGSTAYANDGDVSGNHSSNSDFWIVKLDSGGSIQWKRCYGGTGLEIAYSLDTTSDGGYIVAGVATSNNGDVSGVHSAEIPDYWVVKITGTGNIEWQKALGGTGYDYAYSVVQTNDGGYIVAGESTSKNGDVTDNHLLNGNATKDFWIVKLTPTGNIQWTKSLGGTDSDSAYSVKNTSDNGYIVVGKTGSKDGDITVNKGGFDFWIVKLDSQGNLQWQKTFGGTDYLEEAHSVWENTDGSFLIGGISNSINGDITNYYGGKDFWLIRITNTGSLIWQRKYGGTYADEAHSVQQTQDGGYMIAGSTSSSDGVVTSNKGYTDFWILKLQKDNLSVTETNQDRINIFPNPANDVIYLKGKYNRILSAKIYDNSGKLIKNIKKGLENSTIDVSYLSAGLYFLEISNTDKKDIFRFIKQ